MKPLIILLILIGFSTALLAQGTCGENQFKALNTFKTKHSISDMDLDIVVQLLKDLERANCSDYVGINGGKQYVITTRTKLFGEICLKKNDQKAVDEYVKYLKRQRGSAEEQLSVSFEKIFVMRPEDVLILMGNDKRLLNSLEWGFVNNEPGLTSQNYKQKFYAVIPSAKAIYPKYKMQLDFLLNAIRAELEG